MIGVLCSGDRVNGTGRTVVEMVGLDKCSSASSMSFLAYGGLLSAL